ncbi:hypothetical protein ACIPMT_14225 [Streptomyces griseus]|uniref:hypothetical protein n=1 Tax=Streptomyces griseus TaxID=1911 RepID=UPI003827A257
MTIEDLSGFHDEYREALEDIIAAKESRGEDGADATVHEMRPSKKAAASKKSTASKKTTKKTAAKKRSTS